MDHRGDIGGRGRLYESHGRRHFQASGMALAADIQTGVRRRPIYQTQAIPS